VRELPCDTIRYDRQAAAAAAADDDDDDDAVCLAKAGSSIIGA